MPALSNEQLPILAGALLRLRGLTLAAVFDATGVRAANLSAWLKGKPQVISVARVTALMYYLGVQGGQLRTDIVHTWTDQGDWAHLRAVFTLLQEPVAPRSLFLDNQPGMSQTRYMQWGDAWVRLSLTPGPTTQDDLAAIVRPDRMIVLPVALEGIPTQDPRETGSALLSLAEQGGEEFPSGELAYGFMQRLRTPGAQGFVTTSADAIGWAMLEATLRNAMRAGMSPAELALKIEMKVLG
jgi:transcriptional regulator with XRE-family HTH domain